MKFKTTLDLQILFSQSQQQHESWKRPDQCCCLESRSSSSTSRNRFRLFGRSGCRDLRERHHSVFLRIFLFARQVDQDLQHKVVYAKHDARPARSKAHLIRLLDILPPLVLLLFGLGSCCTPLNDLMIARRRHGEEGDMMVWLGYEKIHKAKSRIGKDLLIRVPYSQKINWWAKGFWRVLIWLCQYWRFQCALRSGPARCVTICHPAFRNRVVWEAPLWSKLGWT